MARLTVELFRVASVFLSHSKTKKNKGGKKTKQQQKNLVKQEYLVLFFIIANG